MQTTTAPKAGNAPDLLQGILSVQVRNEDKITEQDRVYCQTQQNLLYKTLDQIDRWYAVFKEEAEQYQAERKFHYEETARFPCVISTLTITTGKTIHTTSSNRLI